MSSVGGDQVLTAVLDLLREQMPAQLDVLNASAPTVDEQGQAVQVQLDPVKRWRIVADFDEKVDGQLPQVSVDSPGWDDNPGRRATGGGGRVVWVVVVTVLHRGRTATQTLVRTQRYVTAAMDAILAARTLVVAGRQCDVEPVGTAYDEVEQDTRRTLGAGFVELRVSVPNAIAPTAPDEGERPIPVTAASVVVQRRLPTP